MRNRIIAGNWKMNHNLEEAKSFISELTSSIADIKINGVELLIAPASLFLIPLKELSTNSVVKIGSQDVSSQEKGAFTGEISAGMLKSISSDFSIIGHSERRSYHKESDSLIREKLIKLYENDIRPIVCVGETLEQREAAITEEIVLTQLEGCFKDIDVPQHLDTVIAYEPVWAIGTGKTASPEQAEEVHALIRKWITDKYGVKCAQAICILYGGSVKPANIAELLSKENIDGGLIGGAALKVDSYLEMVKIANK
ncbi:MAG: triose-phosphate isomerase [Candidatus Cloacimonetes bacterium 4572_65]|nr:MAG: triose-phosphate isomerase [Candidatus Cloacimonetes bacterium 4572_65]